MKQAKMVKYTFRFSINLLFALALRWFFIESLSLVATKLNLPSKV